MNEIALNETFKQNVCCLWSTSRNELWVKGATSGDTLDLDEVRMNCEQNSLLFLVTPRRKGACHTKDAFGMSRVSCYYRRVVAQPDGSITLAHADPAFPQGGEVLCEPCPASTAPNDGPTWATTAALLAVTAVATCVATAALVRKR